MSTGLIYSETLSRRDWLPKFPAVRLGASTKEAVGV